MILIFSQNNYDFRTQRPKNMQKRGRPIEFGKKAILVPPPTRKFESTQNLHEFERIRAIWENILESFKIIFQISNWGGV